MEITFLSREEKAIEILRAELGDSNDEHKYHYAVKAIRKPEDLEGYDVYVSPANSFGDLKGGIDMQYYLHFGRDELQKKVYSEIKNKYQGEILVGEFCPIFLDGKILLLCPTMTLSAMDISQTRNVYYFTRAMIKGLDILKKSGHKVDKVFCPIPGIGVGGMNYDIAARQMHAAFDAFESRGLVYDVYNVYSGPLDVYSGPLDVYSGPLDVYSGPLDVYSGPLDVMRQAKMMYISMLRNH